LEYYFYFEWTYSLRRFNLQVNPPPLIIIGTAPQGAMSITVQGTDIGNAMRYIVVNRCKYLRRYRGEINIPIGEDKENFRGH
jgi:hypothetical protein